VIVHGEGLGLVSVDVAMREMVQVMERLTQVSRAQGSRTVWRYVSACLNNHRDVVFADPSLLMPHRLAPRRGM
jgi:hypothetical protein